VSTPKSVEPTLPPITREPRKSQATCLTTIIDALQAIAATSERMRQGIKTYIKIELREIKALTSGLCNAESVDKKEGKAILEKDSRAAFKICTKSHFVKLSRVKSQPSFTLDALF
jgi:hypothetical protein